MRTFRSLSILFYLALWTSSSLAARDPEREARRGAVQPPLAGGYSPANADDPVVVEAAEFAVTSLSSSPYSFARMAESSASASSSSYTPRVLQASQQVVAGLNIKLTIMGIQKNPEDACVGAFAATIYNHFGDLSVTAWGREYSCEEAYEFLEEAEQKSSVGDEN
jgi:hypothetical protein